MERAEPAPDPRAGRRKLWTVAGILYATFLLLFLAMPNQVVGRLDDFPSTPLVRNVQRAAMAVAKASDAVGIEPFYQTLRAHFLAAAGIGGG